MPSFKDINGREWAITITLGDIRRVKDAIPSVDLLNMAAGDEPLISRLFVDMSLFCDVLFVIVEPQANKQSIDDAMFASMLGGTAIRQAHTAFWESMKSFFTELGRTHETLAIEKMMATLALQTKLSCDRISQIDPVAICGSISGSSPAS